MKRNPMWLVACCSLLAVAGCAKQTNPAAAAANKQVEDSLPRWMTEGETVRLEIAAKLIEGGNTYAATEIVRSMRAEGFDGPELDLLQGTVMHIEGVNSEAERLLSLATKRMPRDGRAYKELCVLYADEKRPEEAIEACEKATKLAPDEPSSWNNLGYLQLSVGDSEGALRSAQEAVRLDGTQARYRNNLALIQASLGRPGQAMSTFKSVLSKADAAYNVAAALERFDGPEPAKKYYQMALEAQPDHVKATEALSRLETDPRGTVDDDQAESAPAEESASDTSNELAAPQAPETGEKP